MCFHGNQHPWAIKHPFISLHFKYQSLRFICLPVMNSPVFPSLDDIYCISIIQQLVIANLLIVELQIVFIQTRCVQKLLAPTPNRSVN